MHTFTHYAPADLAAFLDAYYDEKTFAQLLHDAAQQIWVVEESGDLIAYAQFSPYGLPHPAPQETAELRRLYVAREHKGKGLGATLLAKVETVARRQGAGALYLGVWSGNFPAQGFYKRHGYSKVAEYDYPPIGPVVDREWIMMKSL